MIIIYLIMIITCIYDSVATLENKIWKEILVNLDRSS